MIGPSEPEERAAEAAKAAEEAAARSIGAPPAANDNIPYQAPEPILPLPLLRSVRG